MNPRRAFTLVELLVVIAIIALLMGISLPVLSKARHEARAGKCLVNIRNMEIAHWMYMTDWKGQFIRVGLTHGAADANEGVAWINTLAEYYGSGLLHHSPLDDSKHWPTDQGGQGVAVHPGPPPAYRRTSYGCNNFLDADLVPYGGPYKLDNVSRPSAVVHFLIMSYEGAFASADHTHVENWVGFAPSKAQLQVQINARSGEINSWEAVSNYGFLDGHAEARAFRSVFTSFAVNSFDPGVAR